MTDARRLARVPFLDLQAEYRFLQSANVEEQLLRVLRTAFFVEGPAACEFERAFADYCGVQEVIAVDSGTAALHLALLALGVGPGDEVIVPVHTFIATAAAVVMSGARPVFVDVDRRTWQMDVGQVSSLIGPKCRAVIAVHLFGVPPDLDALVSLCKDAGLALIEDAAQARGARWRTKRVGSIGDVGCFSFYPSKNLEAFGDAGALVTADPAIAERVRRLRNHGRVAKNEHGEIGYNYRMDELQGRVLAFKLPFLDLWNGRRRQLAAEYRRYLTDSPLCMPEVPLCGEPVWHLFPVGFEERAELSAFLHERGIEVGIHYPVPLHLQPAFRYLGHRVGDFPVAEWLAARILSLPISRFHDTEQIRYVCECLKNYIASGRSRHSLASVSARP